jgi:hypothetical protein
MKNEACTSRDCAWRVDLCLVALLAAAAGCGSSGPGDPRAPFSPGASDHATYSYVQSTEDGGTSVNTFGAVVGTKELGGKTYQRWRFADSLTAPQEGVEPWIRRTEGGRFEFVGGEAYTRALGIGQAGQPILSGTVDQPLALDPRMPVGQPLAIDVTGRATVVGVETATRVQGTIQAIADSVALQTPAGVLHGCRHFQGSFTFTGTALPAPLASARLDADLWYHQEYGMVGVAIRLPPYLERASRFQGVSDFVDLPGGYRMVQKLGVLSAASNTTFQLSTYDLRQQFDADKNTHAKMLLEIRNEDETEARSLLQPSVSIRFGTVWGIFPAQLVQTPASFFHPSENGKGFVYWIAFVDQAAKNEPTNPIAYEVSAQLTSNNARVRCTARILYKVVP